MNNVSKQLIKTVYFDKFVVDVVLTVFMRPFVLLQCKYGFGR